tara:strand:+ start:17752 stop:19362 length:1611 start_codon:yes stop_codon:yes gene_type:complete
MSFKEFFNETCDLNLFMEGTTAQNLRAHKDQELVGLIKARITERLQQLPFFKQPDGQKLFDRYVNFFSYQALRDPSWQELMNKNLNDPTHQSGRWKMDQSEIKQNATKGVGGTVNHMWRNWGDYFAAMGTRLASKLNNPGWTAEMVDAESKEWHEDLASRERGLPNQEAKVFLKLDHLGKQWKGWKWVDLEVPHCPEEAEAMGHCGNSGYGEGDNLLSLRDPEGYAHLTFVVNDGFLGESKGRVNQKPSEKYHDPIVELLKTDQVHAVKGGGHEAHNNFYMSDLNDDRKKALEHKKHLSDPLGHVFEKYKDNRKDMIGAVNEFFNSTDFEDYDGEVFTLDTFENWESLEESAKRWASANIENIGWMDEPYHYIEASHHGLDDSELVDKLNKDNLAKIEELIKDERPDDYEDYELEELISEDEAIMEALNNAANQTQESAIETEAYTSMTRQLNEADENGFYINFSKHPWELSIDTSGVRELHREMQKDGTVDDDEVLSYIKLSYSAPYNGYDGYNHFDDSHYNEMVSDNLYQISPV